MYTNVFASSSTYDHRTLRVSSPVRSASFHDADVPKQELVFVNRFPATAI
jgi:hypothetical protein